MSVGADRAANARARVTVIRTLLPPKAAKMAVVEILLADLRSLGDDVLESCLYLPAGAVEGKLTRARL